MPTVSLPAASSPFPVGTTVAIYPAASRNPGNAPTAAQIASAAVDAANNPSVTSAGILQGVDYVAYAQVGGVTPTSSFARRSTGLVAHGNRRSGRGPERRRTARRRSMALTATSGLFAPGQRIRTVAASAAIPPGTYIKALAQSVSGKAVTADTAGVFTAAAHGYQLGDPVKLSALTGGTGLTAGTVSPRTLGRRARRTSRRTAR